MARPSHLCVSTLVIVFAVAACEASESGVKSNQLASGDKATEEASETYTWDATTRLELVQSAGKMLIDKYIYESVGTELDSMLRTNEEKYSSINDKAAFAQAVTKDLQTLSRDQHLALYYRPQSSDMLDRGSDAQHDMPMMHDQARDVVEARMLDDEIGLLKLTGIDYSDDGSFAGRLDTAIATIINAKAVILDVRVNYGGSPEGVSHVSSYFFGEPTHLVSADFRGGDTMERWTYQGLPNEVFAREPLYVLTSKKTFSAGESLVFGLKAASRGILVGEKTAGGGNFGGEVRLSQDFVLWVSIGRTYDPRTGEGWEASGVSPNIVVDPSQALDVAIGLAKEELSK